MNLEKLLAQGRLRPHKTSGAEITDLLRIATRDLSDARTPGLSSDRRFLIAYDAALTLATIPLHIHGYRTHVGGHHWMTFLVLPEILGAEFESLATYLDLCRTKRNISIYDRGGEISNVEADELIEEAENFRTEVEIWLSTSHPNFIDE